MPSNLPTHTYSYNVNNNTPPPQKKKKKNLAHLHLGPPSRRPTDPCSSSSSSSSSPAPPHPSSSFPFSVSSFSYSSTSLSSLHPLWLLPPLIATIFFVHQSLFSPTLLLLFASSFCCGSYNQAPKQPDIRRCMIHYFFAPPLTNYRRHQPPTTYQPPPPPPTTESHVACWEGAVGGITDLRGRTVFPILTASLFVYKYIYGHRPRSATRIWEWRPKAQGFGQTQT